MADPFSVHQVTNYLTQMGLRTAHVDYEHELVELAFHGNHGQWRMIVGFQQSDESRKLMLIAPHIGALTTKKRLECLEALMAVNYRIAIGKFGIDLDDGEVRLEEAIPVGTQSITFEQFQLVFGALIQTVGMYQGLLPRIIYGNLSVQEALQACEQEFLEQEEQDDASRIPTEPLPADEQIELTCLEAQINTPELDVSDVLAEVTRIFEEKKD